MGKLVLKEKKNLSDAVNKARFAIAEVGNTYYALDTKKTKYREAFKLQILNNFDSVDVMAALKDISNGKSSESWEYFVEGQNAILEYVADGGLHLDQDQVVKGLLALQLQYKTLQDEYNNALAAIKDAQKREEFMRQQGRKARLDAKLAKGVEFQLRKQLEQEKADMAKTREGEVNAAYDKGKKEGKKSAKKWIFGTIGFGATTVGLLIALIATNVNKDNNITNANHEIGNQQETIDEQADIIDQLNEQLAKYGVYVDNLVDTVVGYNTGSDLETLNINAEDNKLTYVAYSTELNQTGVDKIGTDVKFDHLDFEVSEDAFENLDNKIEAVELFYTATYDLFLAASEDLAKAQESLKQYDGYLLSNFDYNDTTYNYYEQETKDVTGLLEQMQKDLADLQAAYDAFEAGPANANPASEVTPGKQDETDVVADDNPNSPNAQNDSDIKGNKVIEEGNLAPVVETEFNGDEQDVVAEQNVVIIVNGQRVTLKENTDGTFLGSDGNTYVKNNDGTYGIKIVKNNNSKSYDSNELGLI